MTAEKKALRRPWLAALLQLILPGLGYFYCGRPRRGIVLHLVMLCAALTGLLALAWVPSLTTFILVVAGILALIAFLIVDAVRCARAANPGYVLARYNRWYIYGLVVLVVSVAQQILLPPILGNFPGHAFRTPTPSMEPTLLVGDHFIADQAAYLFSKPERGDIATYLSPDLERIYIHRIVGLPGETIEIRDRTVFINGQALDEGYANFGLREILREPVAPAVLPADTYFLMGDNRDNSADSRYSGPVHRDRLRGKARILYYSRDTETGQIRWDRIGKVVE